MKNINLNQIKDIKLGHAADKQAITGCTVLLCENGAVAGVDVRGAAPGTRETDLLESGKMINQIHGIMLAGGSAFGLDAAGGVLQYLEENKIGFQVGSSYIPLVPSAILFDLDIGRADIRPDKGMGYRACVNAEKNELKEGNVGAGLGATVGKYKGIDYAMKGGLGIAALQAGNLQVGAVVAVNSLGDIVDPVSGEIIAGALNEEGKLLPAQSNFMAWSKDKEMARGNTTLGLIITNAKLSKAEANQIASAAHNGYAHTISPVHTQFDGDTIFTLATGKVNTNLDMVNVLAVKAVEEAVLSGVKKADSLAGYKSYSAYNK